MSIFVNISRFFSLLINTTGHHLDQNNRKSAINTGKTTPLYLNKETKNCEILLYELFLGKVDFRGWSCGHFDAKIELRALILAPSGALIAIPT